MLPRLLPNDLGMCFVQPAIDPNTAKKSGERCPLENGLILLRLDP